MSCEDALEFVARDGHTFDAIHASPPCQFHTQLSVKHRGKGTRADERVDLIARTREVLQATGRPYVIENVMGARKHMRSPFILHGAMFGLGVHRPRFFETSFPVLVPKVAPRRGGVAVYGKLDGRRLWTRIDGTELRAPKTLEEASAAMGIDWMTWPELTEAIPPAYTEWIGWRLREVLAREAA